MTESKFTVGQKVFDFESGFGEICEILDSNESFPLGVSFFSGGVIHYRIDGRLRAFATHPSLLTLEQAALLGYFPESMNAPVSIFGYCGEDFKMGDIVTTSETGRLMKARPEKKKVKKSVVGWVNVYPKDRQVLYYSEEDANGCAGSDRIACVRVEGTYEVEE